MSYTRIGAVTGANKGIGLAIVRQLALQYPSSNLNNGPLLIYLTARDRVRGDLAVKSLEEDVVLKKAKALRADGGLSDVKYHYLDVNNTESIRDFSNTLRREHEGGLDFVVSNAGIAESGFDATVVQKTLTSNYYGTLEVTRQFLPILKPTGRIINVSSMVGHLKNYSGPLRTRFRHAKSVQEITALMEEFHSAVKDGTYKEQGWPASAYAVSKAGVTGMTRMIAYEELGKGGQRLINSCCPGYVDTDMTKHRGVKTPDQGAQTPVMLAIGDIGRQTGEFWQDEKITEW